MSDSEDWFNRRPLRLEHLFTKLRTFYFVTFNTAKRARLLTYPEITMSFACSPGERMNNSTLPLVGM